MILILGIDAGNSRLKCAVANPTGKPQLLHNQWGEPNTPSVVYFPPEGGIVIGTEALNAAYAHLDRVVINWKRYIGTDKVLFREGNQEYRASDILEIFLGETKRQAEATTGETVDEAVITVPANYTDPQRQETIDAAEQAGLKLLPLVHEPTAAALGNEVFKKGNSTTLVYDLGGGTFDVSIVKVAGNSTQVIATGGEPKLGGQDFNQRILEKALAAFETEYGTVPDKADEPVFYQELDARIEHLKTVLSVQEQGSLIATCNGNVLNMKVTRDDFNSWCGDLVEKSIARTLTTISEANLSPDQIDTVLAVGGGSLIPLVSQELEKALGKKTSNHCEPHYAAAYGAVWASRIEYQKQGRVYNVKGGSLPSPNLVLKEVTSHPIGVSVVTEDDRLVCSEILAKHVPIPSEQVRRFKLSYPFQTEVQIEVLQGGEGMPKEGCVFLGDFTLTDLPAREELTPRIEITLKLDQNGILTATAQDMEGGKSQDLRIDYQNGKDQFDDAA